MSTELPMAGYFIYRAGEQSDPTSSLEFCPPKDSDELFFALKTTYPHVKTHSERMRNAVIEFLIKERDEEQLLSQMAPPPLPVESSFSYDAESPWSSWPSMSSTSTLSSPDMVNLATPASMSSSSLAPTMGRQSSQAQPACTPNNGPALEDMTGVFSLSSESQPKTRIRRKMTDSEKAEYRKRRIVKACEACSKRKRKCSHNKTDMEKVQSSKVAKAKVKVHSPTVRVEQVERALVQQPEPFNLVEDPFVFLDQSLFSEASAVDDSLFDFNAFDNFFAPAPKTIAQQSHQGAGTGWPWCDTQDFTLLDTPLHAQAPATWPAYEQALFPVSTGGLLSPDQSPLLGSDLDSNQNMSECALTGRQTPTRTWRSFADFSRSAFSTADGLDGKEMPLRHNTPTVTTGDTASPTQLSYVLPLSEPLTGPTSTSTTNATSAQPHPQASTPQNIGDLHEGTAIPRGPQTLVEEERVIARSAASSPSSSTNSSVLPQGQTQSSQHSLVVIATTASAAPSLQSSVGSEPAILPAQASSASSSGQDISLRPITRNSAHRLANSSEMEHHESKVLLADNRGSSPSSICPDALGTQPLQRHRHKVLAPPLGEGLPHGNTGLATGYLNNATDIAVTVFMAQLSSTWRLMTRALVQAMCLNAFKSCKRRTFAAANTRHTMMSAALVTCV